MGRKKKTLHDYAAEFSDLGVKRHVVEQHTSGERTLVEILYCKSCEITVRVRRDRILEHLASARHYRNKRLAKLWDRKPPHTSSETEVHPSSPVELDSTSPLSLQSQLILHGNPFTSLPSPVCQPGPPVHSSSITSTSCRKGVSSSLGDAAPSTSASKSHTLPASRVRSPGPTVPASSSSPWLAVPEPSNSAGRHYVFEEVDQGSLCVGLALFGVNSGSRALCQSLVEEKGCQLLYIVEEQRWEVESVFSQEHLAHTRVLRTVDTDVVLSDQRRFDPALQYLYKRVNENDSLGSVQRVAAVSRLYPRPTVARIKASEVASVNDADSVMVSMKFPSGAIASLDISQHCHKSCDQRLEVHGSEGTLQMENRNPLGICDRSTSSGLCLQSTADRFRDAYKELLRHFLRTLRGVEPPFITKEQYLWTVQVAAAAEQSWKNGSAVDLRNEVSAADIMVIKTEA
ncbi:hypothetical protein JZ751_014937 [Albula glossodonta]|uniref:GFO/IDH/MocA-like oxidoreductase domain-containing protein n=1 Tax=Albula glossodonta TaxID=121402 RepID=A0A8T2N4T7_9TELE|nr:hypothetical protein JZ751_014937 [Albula glossodonta]